MSFAGLVRLILLLCGQVNATDADSEAFGNVSYEVFPESSLFSVTKLDSGEGEVRVEGLIDRETIDRYMITILARDGGMENLKSYPGS